jgi:tetratricopeptide (TPR) repeat protein
MFCTACGTRNADVSNFCKQCGHNLERTDSNSRSDAASGPALLPEAQVVALLERAYRLRKSGELPAAVQLCEEALRLNPESTSVHSLLGQIHEQMGNRDAAIQEYERVLQLNPGSIADRLKLDELRADGLPAPLHPRSAPAVLMAKRSSPGPNPSGRQMLGIAGVGGALMLLGGLLAIQFRAHQEQNPSGLSRQTTGVGATNPQSDARLTGGAAPGTGVASNPGTPVGAGTASPNAVVSNANVGSPGLPANATFTGYQQGYPPPPVYNNNTPPTRVVYTTAPPATGGGSRRSGTLPNMSNMRVQPVGDGSEERIHLAEGSGGQYSINIKPGGDSELTSPIKSSATSKKGIPNEGSAIPGKIKVHSNGGGNGEVSAPPPSSTEAQSLIMIASDKFKTGDYEAAIKSYNRALPGAGSQTAYVYQQMGICFQRIKNKTRAIENFNTAIREYQKLEQANQQVDLAHAGIKVCENGIKLCNAE